ncbi:MAG: glycosyltransferase [Geminicoccaceae bacterium]|nr:glycosyltransferase [Geminicoccaceae bacterium]
MTAACPLALSAPRYAVACFGLERDRARRQPWHVALGLARGLAAHGCIVVLVTDAREPPAGEAFEVLRLSQLFDGHGPSRELRELLLARRVERLFLFTGACALARMRPLALACPVTLVLASPRLRLRELFAPGPRALWRERRVLALPLANALLPGFALRRGFRRAGAGDVLYLSETARRRYAALGLPTGEVLRPQVTVPLRPRCARREPARVVYLGPALAARGVDLAIAAFERARALGLDAELWLLIRPDSGPAALAWLTRRLARSSAASAIRLETRMLGPEEVAEHLAIARAALLPFRAPVSEVPLVVIEAALSGATPVVLDAPGVGEYARALGGIVARSPADLPAALLEACRRPPPPPPDPAPWTSWKRAVEPLVGPSLGALARYRLIALCGPDGSGKTVLVQRLRDRLARERIASRRVWSRFRNYLSKPLLALARLTGHNRKERYPGFALGYHDFENSWYARPFLALQAVDLALDVRLRFRGRTLLLADRCCLDTLVDLCVDTGLEDLVFGRLGPRILRLLPRPAAAVVIERDPALIAESRPDALADRHFARRRALYRRLAETLGIPVVSNDGPIEHTIETILALLAQGRGELFARR